MKKGNLKTIGITISVLVLFLFSLSLIYQKEVLSLLQLEEGIYGTIVLFFLAFFMEFIPQYLSPHLLIFNIAILKIPLLSVTILVIIGSIFGSLLGFEVGRKTSPKEFSKERLKKVRYYISKYGKFFMAIAAISPLPYFPMIFGFLKIKRFDFLIFGILPRSIGIILLGLLLGGEIF
jgi:membrane protein YqaA with SNARE-associated domain